MCSVAAGRVDAYWEFGLHAWDMAAADLIIREAGGVTMSTDGIIIFINLSVVHLLIYSLLNNLQCKNFYLSALPIYYWTNGQHLKIVRYKFDD